MNNKFKLSLLSTIFAFSINTAYALTQPNNSAAVNNTFVFFENQIDQEYYIGPGALDPRFTGANRWIRFGTLNQTSLGYMGSTGTWTSNWNADMWFDTPLNAPPFLGIRCMSSNNNCPSSGYLAAEYIDNFGAYKARYVGGGEAGGSYRRATFNTGMYEYMRDQPVGSISNFIFNTCQTREEYNPAAGGRCQDATTGNWTRRPFNVTKLGHVRFVDTRAFSEIWVASDGTPSLAENSEFCREINLNTGNQNSTVNRGIACRMLEYRTEGAVSSYPNAIRFSMVVDNTTLGYTPAATHLKINAGVNPNLAANWRNYSTAGQLNTLFVDGDGYVSVLFTNEFFIRLLRAGGSVSGQPGTFTFSITNTLTGQSGYYQFATGVDVNIIPREYGISIRPQNREERAKTGRIGEGEEDIRFDYIVTQSAPRQADVVQASVIGESNVNAGRSYCLFRSNDNAMSVRIPAYLSYTHSSGNTIEQYSGCNSNATLDMTNANWSAVPWDQQQSGYFYSTNLSLSFPMDDPASLFSVEGMDWLGSVRAEGDVRVEALWIGVDR